MDALRFQFRFVIPASLPRYLARLILAVVILWIPTLTARAQRGLPADSHGMRSYYVTKTVYPANTARIACDEGYHFASIWELADISNLRYNTDLGGISADSGSGPPSVYTFLNGTLRVQGWIRTGYSAYNADTAGKANCGNWLSNSASHWGTVARLPTDWINGEKDVGVWDVLTQTCDAALNRVWCIEDNVASFVFLPVVLR